MGQQHQEFVTREEFMLLKRLRTIANSTVMVIVNNEGVPVGWTVLYKIERPPNTQL